MAPGLLANGRRYRKQGSSLTYTGKRLPPDDSTLYPEGNYWAQRDNAPPHSIKAAMESLNSEPDGDGGNRVKSWSASRPDLGQPD